MAMIPECWGVAATLAWIAFRNDKYCEAIQELPHISLGGLGTWLAIYQATDRSIECLTSKETELLKALQSGNCRAWAVKNRSGDLVAIGSGEWTNLKFGTDHRRNSIIAEPIPNWEGREITFSHILIAIEDVTRNWPPKGTANRIASATARSYNKDLWIDEALKLLKEGHPPNKAKLARIIRERLGSPEQPETIEKAIRPTVNEWTRTLKNPENPGTAVRD
jgi:hypothetical protein